MIKKLITGLGGLTAILSLAGGIGSNVANAQKSLESSQRREFNRFYDEGRAEGPSLVGDMKSEKGLQIFGLNFRLKEETVKKRVDVPKTVYYKMIDSCGNRCLIPGVVYEPQLKEHIKTRLECDYDEKKSLWYKGWQKGKEATGKVCEKTKPMREGIKRSGRVLKEDLYDLGHDVKRGGCKVVEGSGDILSVPFSLGGSVLRFGSSTLDRIGRRLDRLGEHPSNGAIEYRAPGKLDRIYPNDYQRTVPSTRQPTYVPQSNRFLNHRAHGFNSAIAPLFDADPSRHANPSR